MALEPVTKLIPVWHLSARTQRAAHRVVHDLHQRLAPDCLPVFTSDGLNLYFYALTAHFGHWVRAVGRRARQWHVRPGLISGQVKKTYRRRKVVRVTRVMRSGTLEQLRATLCTLGLSGRLTTFVERVNLTLRQGVAALARRTWATRAAAVSPADASNGSRTDDSALDGARPVAGPAAATPGGSERLRTRTARRRSARWQGGLRG